MGNDFIGNFVGAIGAQAIIIFTVAAFIALILYIFLPFAVFGTKSKLDKLIEEQEKTNFLLRKLVDKQDMNYGQRWRDRGIKAIIRRARYSI